MSDEPKVPWKPVPGKFDKQHFCEECNRFITTGGGKQCPLFKDPSFRIKLGQSCFHFWPIS